MSQAGVSSNTLSPSVPTSIVTDAGIAVPIANILEILGGTGITTSGATNVVTITFNGGAGFIQTLTGNSGGAVSPTTGNVNIVGSGNVNVVGSPGTSTLTITANGSSQTVNYTGVSTTPYVVLSTDYYLGVDTTVARTIQLPNAPSTGRIFVVKDVTGTSAANPITVTTVGGVVLIDGATSYTINSAFQAISLLFAAGAYQVY